jgi:hypothetical protein
MHSTHGLSSRLFSSRYLLAQTYCTSVQYSILKNIQVKRIYEYSDAGKIFVVWFPFHSSNLFTPSFVMRFHFPSSNLFTPSFVVRFHFTSSHLFTPSCVVRFHFPSLSLVYSKLFSEVPFSFPFTCLLQVL